MCHFLPALSSQTAPEEATKRAKEISALAEGAYRAGQFELAITRYLEIVRIAPNSPGAYNNLGMIYLQLHRLEDAKSALERALALDPKRASAKAMLGMAYYQLGEIDQAQPLLEAAVSDNNRDDRAEMMLSLILVERKKYSEASQHLANFLVNNPENQKAWYLLRQIGLDMAEDARLKINGIDSDSAIAHETAGEIDEQRHDFASALTEYQKTIQRDPDQPHAHMHLADTYWHLLNWKEAASEYRAELVKDGSNCSAHWRLADSILEGHGATEEALTHLEKAIKACPTLLEARIDRARALLRLGRTADAIADLLLAEKAKPGDASIHYMLAGAYKATGEAEKARQEMQTFVALKANSIRE